MDFKEEIAMPKNRYWELRETFEETLRHIDLLRRSTERMKQRIKPMSLSAAERDSLLSEIGSMQYWLKQIEPNLQTQLKEAKISLYTASSQSMWTTNKDDWWLTLEKRDDGTELYSIEYGPVPGTMNYEDVEWYEFVLERMKEAGNMVISRSAYDEFIAHYIADAQERRDLNENT
jgi:hypothetical protein